MVYRDINYGWSKQRVQNVVLGKKDTR